VDGVRGSSEAQARAASTIAAAAQVERYATDLETGRSIVAARRALPRAAARLEDVLDGTSREGEAAALADSARVYAASGAPGSADGARRAAAIRARVARLMSTEEQVAADARERVRAQGHRALGSGIVGLVVSGVLLLLFVLYFIRAAVRPLRRLVESAGRIAGGDFGARVPPGSAGQLGELAEGFNAMAESLQRSRGELQRQVNVTQTVLDSTIDGICLTGPDGEIVLANRPLIQFVLDLELPFAGGAQQSLLAVSHRFVDPERYRTAIERITPELAEPTMDEFTFADSDRCFQGFTTPVVDDDGKITGRVWTLREVTAERAADRLKDDFIATVSHELRTPLTSIVGFLEIVMRSSQRLMRQVGDLLFISQLDSAGLTLSLEPVDVGAVVRDAAEQAAALARQREIELSVAAREVELVCDRERIAQVVANLLSNAVKFTPAGGSVEVRAFAEDGSGVVEVEDSGIGIPEAERDRLFQRFFRSSRSTEQAIQGTGLGLAISQAIVQAHGGTIEASAAPEQGTLFRVTLPRRVIADLAP
jgi:signal transduction histidine kinase